MKFDNTYVDLPESFYSESTPDEFSSPELLAYNEDLAETLGIDLKELTQEELAQVFSGQKILEGSQIISTVYAAHQFGSFVPRLGDGRAMLLGEVVNSKKQRFDIQLKGSGPTVYSRNGDGLSALGPVIREYIVSEAMHYLGVPTTRALAAVHTGDSVFRPGGETPGGVLTRVASSHIRIGTFQYFANRGDYNELIELMDYSIDRHFPEIRQEMKENSEELNPALLFLRKVIRKQITLVTQWMTLGFIHGVMNTDNTTICGETIDFGPCAFMDIYKADKKFSSIDSYGRYAYNSQRKICAWNLCRLADCLIPLIAKKSEDAVELLNKELSAIPTLLETQWLERFSLKFGFVHNSEFKKEDDDLINAFLEYLEKEELDFTLGFRNLAESLTENTDFFPETEDFKNFKESWLKRLNFNSSEDFEKIKKSMWQVNPRYIPRNHQVEKAIQGANEGDLSTFHEMNELLKNPYNYQEKLDRYSIPPQPEEEVKATFCGT